MEPASGSLPSLARHYTLLAAKSSKSNMRFYPIGQRVFHRFLRSSAAGWSRVSLPDCGHENPPGSAEGAVRTSSISVRLLTGLGPANGRAPSFYALVAALAVGTSPLVACALVEAGCVGDASFNRCRTIRISAGVSGTSQVRHRPARLQQHEVLFGPPIADEKPGRELLRPVRQVCAGASPWACDEGETRTAFTPTGCAGSTIRPDRLTAVVKAVACGRSRRSKTYANYSRPLAAWRPPNRRPRCSYELE